MKAVEMVVVAGGVGGFCWRGTSAWLAGGEFSATVPAEFEELVPGELQLALVSSSTGWEGGGGGEEEEGSKWEEMRGGRGEIRMRSG